MHETFKTMSLCYLGAGTTYNKEEVHIYYHQRQEHSQPPNTFPTAKPLPSRCGVCTNIKIDNSQNHEQILDNSGQSYVWLQILPDND